MSAPLRKCKEDGALYQRDAAIEARLAQLAELPRSDALKLCGIRQRGHPDYVPSECLLHLVRACRHDNKNDYFDRLYGLLFERVVRALPRAVGGNGRSESATITKIREYVLDRFVAHIVADRSEYNESLDYFEVRFDSALVSLKLSGRKKAWREENRSQPIEIDAETGELPPEIEQAAGTFDPLAPAEMLDEAYRLRLQAAIDTLPEEQIRIVTMLRKEIPIESEDPNVMTIARTLGRTPKTIRKYRNQAFAALRTILRSEDGQ